MLVSLSRRNADSLTHKELDAHAPGVAQCDKMLSEATEGEISLLESTEARRHLRTRLGLRPMEDDREKLSAGSVAPSAEPAARRSHQRKPGRRRPVRDAVGTADSAYANAGSL